MFRCICLVAFSMSFSHCSCLVSVEGWFCRSLADPQLRSHGKLAGKITRFFNRRYSVFFHGEMFHCHVSFRVGVSAAYNVSMQITSLERYPLNRHPSKGPQVLHLQDIFVRLAIVILHLQGNHFLSCQKPTGTGPGKIYIQMSHPSEGVISPTLSESLRFDPAQLDSRDLMNVLDPWTHSKAAKKFKGSKTLGGKRQAQPLLQHSSWMGARKFCEEQKVVPTVEPRAMSGGYLVGNFLKRKSKKSSILTKIEAFTR